MSMLVPVRREREVCRRLPSLSASICNASLGKSSNMCLRAFDSLSVVRSISA